MVIKIKNISKKYSVAKKKKEYLTLSSSITNVLKVLFSRNGVNKKINQEFWALKDVNLKIEQGEVVGVIGANGAGKSTLLKILSKITPPTVGEIEINGRVASLLEVGTGFNPELTGRENVYLNGIILGMTKKEVNERFDDIVEFSGVREFIDMPVKRYSSGMNVRLAFSVAAYLKPEILLIDEVLAVGDVEFQQKCLGKMNSITREENRTILFVSHNMDAIQKLCKKCILLEGGKVKKFGDTKEVVETYLNKNSTLQSVYEYGREVDKVVQIKKVEILNHLNDLSTTLDTREKFCVVVTYELKQDLKKNNGVYLKFFNENKLAFITYDIDTNENFYKNRSKGTYTSSFKFLANFFNQQTYRLSVGCGVPQKYCPGSDGVFFDLKENLKINFSNPSSFASKFFKGKRSGSFLLEIYCDIKKRNDAESL